MFFCGNAYRYWLSHLEFNEFHISFHNLGQIFRELRSRAREEFRVCFIAAVAVIVEVAAIVDHVAVHHVVLHRVGVHLDPLLAGHVGVQ